METITAFVNSESSPKEAANEMADAVARLK
jgi:hypothetical protein